MSDMEIQIDITEKDLIDFNLYHLSHSPTMQRQRWVLLLPGLLWSGFWLGLAALSEEPLRTAKALLPLIMGGPLYIATFLLLWRRSVSRQIQKHLAEGKNKGIFGPHKV